MLVADHIFSLARGKLSRQQLDLAITVLMLLPNGRSIGLGYKGILAGRYQVDHRFVVKLLQSARSTKVQWAIVASPAFAHLPAGLYRRLFLRFWDSRRTGAWRYVLAKSLHVFLQDHPREARFYAEHLWALARHPDKAVAALGLSSLPFLGGWLTSAQVEVLVATTRDASTKASAATSALGTLYRDLERLHPEVRALLLDPRTVATVRSAHPPDGRGRWSCHRWCMTHMTEALARARKGRVAGPDGMSRRRNVAVRRAPDILLVRCDLKGVKLPP